MARDGAHPDGQALVAREAIAWASSAPSALRKPLSLLLARRLLARGPSEDLRTRRLRRLVRHLPILLPVQPSFSNPFHSSHASQSSTHLRSSRVSRSGSDSIASSTASPSGRPAP